MSKFTYMTPEILISMLFLVLLGLLVNPFGVLMLSNVQMILLVITIIVFIIFTGLIWKERASDEREQLHLMLAGRFGYLAGIIVLVIGVVAQTLNHKLDIWLVGALCAMILAKILGLLYGKVKH